MIINHFTFKFYAFLEFLWLQSENVGISASKGASFLGPNSHFLDFSWKVEARVIIFAVMQKFDEKRVFFGWFMAFFKGRHNVPPCTQAHPEALAH